MSSKSRIFYTDVHKDLEKKIKEFLNAQADFLSPRTIGSPRAVGDAIENILVENFGKITGDLIKDYSSDFARRSMADFAFTDKEGFYYVVDVKTHRLDTKFNMPNLISVERLTKFYGANDINHFLILKVDYRINGAKIVVEKITFAPIEFLSWNCLTIGALGWGQIQIANANIVKIIRKNSRKQWMLELCDTLLDFYPNEIGKINGRIDYFKQVKKYWRKKEE